MPDIPQEAITAAEAAIKDQMRASREIEPDALARAALEAAAPLLEKRFRRAIAREILALDEAERAATKRGARNVGPYGDAVISLRRLARGEPLPKPHELHGGSADA